MKRNRSHVLQRWSYKLAMLALLSLTASCAFAQQFKRVVIFGDSLSDPGNYFVAFHTALVPPFVSTIPGAPFVPDAPYVAGLFHFSNGPTWAEQFTAGLRLPGSGLPAFLLPRYFNNYAVGRARARSGSPVFSAIDLSTEVARFIADGKTGSPSDLFVFWIGSDDLSDALNDQAHAGDILTAALTATLNNIQVLYGKGARSFMVVNLPNPAVTPFVSFFGPVAQAGSAQATGLYNGLLSDYVNAVLPAVLPGTRFIYLDSNAILQSVIADPGSFGLQNVTNSCITPNVVGGAFCEQPNTYLFWDGTHPTVKGHSIVAQAALKAIGATVQQPSWGDNRSNAEVVGAH